MQLKKREKSLRTVSRCYGRSLKPPRSKNQSQSTVSAQAALFLSVRPDLGLDSNISTLHTHFPVFYVALRHRLGTDSGSRQRTRGREGPPTNCGSIPDRDKRFFSCPEPLDRVSSRLVCSLMDSFPRRSSDREVKLSTCLHEHSVFTRVVWI